MHHKKGTALPLHRDPGTDETIHLPKDVFLPDDHFDSAQYNSSVSSQTWSGRRNYRSMYLKRCGKSRKPCGMKEDLPWRLPSGKFGDNALVDHHDSGPITSMPP
jgi:hypothetical protein